MAKKAKAKAKPAKHAKAAAAPAPAVSTRSPLLSTSTLRPGLLVSLNTSITGNVSYVKEVLEPERLNEAGEKHSKWTTERNIADAKEHEEAIEARSLAGTAIRSVCSQTAFGLLCPEIDVEKLDAGIAKAHAIIDAFNAKARITRVKIYCIKGRIAPDDVEAVQSINKEVRDLMEAMQAGIANCDVNAVREAASKAREVGSMLSIDAESKIKVAIETARAAATAINKAGEQASFEIDKAAIRKITECRTAFLDLREEQAVAKPKASARAADLAPVAGPPIPAKPKAARRAAAEL